nr:helix-turn-helix domain-containing protein [Shewanella abyssi]
MGDALINEAMSRTANSQTAAARMLGISQSALSRRLK